MKFRAKVDLTREEYLKVFKSVLKPKLLSLKIIYVILAVMLAFLAFTSYLEGDFFITAFYAICAGVILVLTVLADDMLVKNSFKVQEKLLLDNPGFIEFSEETIKAESKYSKAEYPYELLSGFKEDKEFCWLVIGALFHPMKKSEISDENGENAYDAFKEFITAKVPQKAGKTKNKGKAVEAENKED